MRFYYNFVNQSNSSKLPFVNLYFYEKNLPNMKDTLMNLNTIFRLIFLKLNTISGTIMTTQWSHGLHTPESPSSPIKNTISCTQARIHPGAARNLKA
jgi:hypothetical protein